MQETEASRGMSPHNMSSPARHENRRATVKYVNSKKTQRDETSPRFQPIREPSYKLSLKGKFSVKLTNDLRHVNSWQIDLFALMKARFLCNATHSLCTSQALLWKTLVERHFSNLSSTRPVTLLLCSCASTRACSPRTASRRMDFGCGAPPNLSMHLSR